MKSIVRRFQNTDNWTFLYLLVAIALASLLFSAISHWLNGDAQWWGWADNAFQNFSMEMAGAIMTFGIFHFVIGVRNEKQRLVQDVASQSNEIARAAIDALRLEGWLEGKEGMLRGINLEQANLQQADLKRANLQKTKFGGRSVTEGGANLQQADLMNADLGLADLMYANLQEAYFVGTDLQEAYLVGANLQGAYMRESNLQDAKLWNANLHATNLQDANLRNAKLERVQFDERTVLPDAQAVMDAQGDWQKDAYGNYVFDKYWTSQTDMSRYTDPNQPNFWQPAYLTPGHDGFVPYWVKDE
jgi:pentapeptide repeat protein